MNRAWNQPVDDAARYEKHQSSIVLTHVDVGGKIMDWMVPVLAIATVAMFILGGTSLLAISVPVAFVAIAVGTKTLEHRNIRKARRLTGRTLIHEAAHQASITGGIQPISDDAPLASLLPAADGQHVTFMTSDGRVGRISVTGAKKDTGSTKYWLTTILAPAILDIHQSDADQQVIDSCDSDQP